MKKIGNSSRRGFSLVELLAVVLVLAVLAAVAIPLYTNMRRASAARACKANIAAIAAAESAYALRNAAYTATMANLVGAAEGLAETPKCPLTGTATYTLTITSGALAIRCTNDTTHDDVLGVTADYTKTLSATAAETLP